ncbi:PT domain-containing protein [Patescibacteria group bacterium]|nr:PT domain-containing protein [Patescibacteria group bacterium]
MTLERATFADGSVVKALPRGSTVQIKANVYNGWEFKNWNTYGWTVALASQAAITTMTVPDSALVTVSASYKQLPAPPPQPRPAPQSNTTGWIVVALFLIALAILALAASYLSKPSAAAPTAQPPAATPTPDWYAPCPAGTLADGTSYPEIKKGMTVKVELKDGSWLRLSCDYGYTTKPSSQPIDATPTAMPTAAPTVVPTTAPTLAPAVSSGNTISDALKLVGPAPYKTVEAKDEKGRKVILVNAGFDLNEFGGNDAKCTRTELDSIHIGEVVSSQSEGCLTVLEWSLKLDASTVMAGTYPLKPGEWFYIPLAVSGVNDHVRIVGTLWYLPKGWNAHMYAADLASDRDTRDATHSIVGLSPTDDYVVKLANALLGK